MTAIKMTAWQGSVARALYTYIRIYVHTYVRTLHFTFTYLHAKHDRDRFCATAGILSDNLILFIHTPLKTFEWHLKLFHVHLKVSIYQNAFTVFELKCNTN